MATSIVPGQRSWSCTRDEEGHREYKIKHLVKGLTTDGPANALATPGLPVPGAVWAFDNDLDIWAFCRPNATVTPVVDKEPNRFFEVEQTFSTKPLKRCQDEMVEDPLLEPMKVSGSFTKYTEEGTTAKLVEVRNFLGEVQRTGTKILNSAFEQIRGPQNEWDQNRATVRIEQNVPLLEMDVFSPMINTVNDTELWDHPTRTVKLSSVSWEKKYWGFCNIYYTRVLEFEVFTRKDEEGDVVSGWDRDILDEGTKALHGKNVRGEWVIKPVDFIRDIDTGEIVLDDNGDPETPILPDNQNPSHFVRYKDAHDENTTVILDGTGRPIDTTPGTGSGEGLGEAGVIHVEKYEESNFLLLGIPLVL